MNLFKKCLRKDFGKTTYQRYVAICYDTVARESLQGKEAIQEEEMIISKDMYEQLKQLPKATLRKRLEKLNEIFYIVPRLSRNFLYVFVFYIVASILLVFLELEYKVTVVSLILMGMCFLYKCLQYISNRFCYIDAYLIVIYRTVLEKLRDKCEKCEKSETQNY